MIRQLTGKIIEISEKSLILEVGGVGYEIFCTTDDLVRAKIGDEKTFKTKLVIKEDAHELYGFGNREDLSFFESLLGVSGVGPKTAVSIISIGSTSSLKKAIGGGDVEYLKKVSGIGKKTAEKIVIELRDKLHALGHTSTDGALGSEADAILALESLGYTREDAREALKDMPENVTDVGAKITLALKKLNTKR